MKKIVKTTVTVILLASVTTFQDCETIDDKNTNVICNADCTTIQGQFTTEDGKPMKEVDVEIDWSVTYGGLGLGLGGNTRKIMTGKTDGNGNYKSVFYAKDDELTDGSYVVKFDVSEDTYIVRKNYTYFEFSHINKRDTVLIGNYHVPKKGATLELKIKNPEAITGNNQLISSVYYKYHLNNSIYFIAGELNSNNVSSSIIKTAANQFTYIKTVKKINGTDINLLDSLVISVNQAKIYEIEF